VADTPLSQPSSWPAALGTRMKSAVPKHFHEILGRRMVDWIIETGPRKRGRAAARRDRLTEPARDEVRLEWRRGVAIQETPLGTGDAVRSARGVARRARRRQSSCSPADTPLLTAGLLRELVEAHHREGADATTILSAQAARPRRLYGRVRAATGTARCSKSRRRDRPASDEEQKIREINSSIYVFRSQALWAGARPAEAERTCRGSCTSPTRSRSLPRVAGKVAAHIAADSAPRPTV